MKNLYLVAHIAGQRIAIESEHVESVVTVQDVVPVPKSDPSIAGLFALRSRVLTLIDSQYLVTGQRAELVRGALAVVADIGGHHYGLLVEMVEDVVSVQSSVTDNAIKPSRTWGRLINGMIMVGDEIVMVLDPSRLVAGEQAAAA